MKVASANADSIESAIKWIKSLTSEPEVGQVYEGKVVKVMEFGAFENFFGAQDGLVHVSQLARERVEKPGDVVKEGDTAKVKILGFDDRGKTKLSMKVVEQETGEDLTEKLAAERVERGEAPEGEREERGERADRGERRDRGRGRGRRERETEPAAE